MSVSFIRLLQRCELTSEDAGIQQISGDPSRVPLVVGTSFACRHAAAWMLSIGLAARAVHGRQGTV